MKYIKLFENFFERVDFGDNIWIEADWYLWDEMVSKQIPGEITEFEIKKISSIMNSQFKNAEIRTISRYPLDGITSCISVVTEKNSAIVIYKFIDDIWLTEIFEFESEDDNKFFCDGLDGLFEWISDFAMKLN